jgi:hypothetical protein
MLATKENTVLKPIQTYYKGYHFRSRLEARWAVLLDTLGVKWEYEKQGYDLGDGLYYLPDFWLPEKEIWIEVKGEYLEEDYIKVKRLTAQSRKEVHMVIGEIGKHEIRRLSIKPEETLKKDINGRVYFRQAYDGEVGIHCPICQESMTFFGGVEKRDDTVIINMLCACRCDWSVVFYNHDGSMHLYIENASEAISDSELVLWLAKGDKELEKKAILAAKQARFEHGETPT